MLVSQSYNIFNRYGKDGDALRDITRAFIEDLSEFPEDKITAGFKAWRQKKDGMPTPANIINEIKNAQETSYGGLRKFSDWGKSWESYKEYLQQSRILSPNFDRIRGELKLREGYIPQWTAKDFK